MIIKLNLIILLKIWDFIVYQNEFFGGLLAKIQKNKIMQNLASSTFT